MNELQIFNNSEFGEIRAIKINNEPWFVATDVCESLGLSNPTVAVNRLDEDERSKFNLGRQGEANVINEYGLYNLILSSRKKGAKEFKRWITHEVIPSIRKHGMYATDELLDNPDLLISVAKELKFEKERRKLLETEREQNKPKVLFAQSVQASNKSILVGDMAKLIKQNGVDIGQNKLFAWLRDNGYVIRRKGESYNLPTQKSMELGILEIKESTHINPDGSVRLTKTTKVTGKGQIYFINKFLAS